METTLKKFFFFFGKWGSLHKFYYNNECNQIERTSSDKTPISSSLWTFDLRYQIWRTNIFTYIKLSTPPKSKSYRFQFPNYYYSYPYISSDWKLWITSLVFTSSCLYDYYFLMSDNCLPFRSLLSLYLHCLNAFAIAETMFQARIIEVSLEARKKKSLLIVFFFFNLILESKLRKTRRPT